VYLRGGLALHALRLTVGTETFFRIVTTWVEEYGGWHAETSDFIRLSEDISGQDLGALFDEWLFDEGLPDLPEG